MLGRDERRAEAQALVQMCIAVGGELPKTPPLNLETFMTDYLRAYDMSPQRRTRAQRFIRWLRGR